MPLQCSVVVNNKLKYLNMIQVLYNVHIIMVIYENLYFIRTL